MSDFLTGQKGQRDRACKLYIRNNFRCPVFDLVLSRLSRLKMRKSEIGETDVGGEIMCMPPSPFVSDSDICSIAWIFCYISQVASVI